MLHATQNLTFASTATEDMTVVELNGSNYPSEADLTVSGCAGTFGTFGTYGGCLGTFGTYGCDGGNETATDIAR